MKDLLKSKKFWAIAGTTAVLTMTAILVVYKKSRLEELDPEDMCLDA